jgi:hypothetical protein
MRFLIKNYGHKFPPNWFGENFISFTLINAKCYLTCERHLRTQILGFEETSTCYYVRLYLAFIRVSWKEEISIQ